MNTITPYDLYQELTKLEKEKEGFESNKNLAIKGEIISLFTIYLSQSSEQNISLYLSLLTSLVFPFLYSLANSEVYKIQEKITRVKQDLHDIVHGDIKEK